MDMWLRRNRLQLFLALQLVALVAGNYVGWSTIFGEVSRFCDVQGRGLWGLTDFTGTAVKNPLLTPCFWGSLVFLVTFAWTLSMMLEKDLSKVRQQLARLWWVLLGGTLFALVNNIPIFYKFYTQDGPTASCSAGLVRNPFATSCFLGFSAFLAAFVFASLAKRYGK